MKFIKKISFGLLLLLFTWGAAQTVSPKAKSILDAVSANYKAKKSNYFQFSIVLNGKKQNGTLYSSGSKYRLSLMGTDQIFDGNKVYSISKEDSEVTIAKPTSSDMLFSPISYLEVYKKGYNIQYVGRRKVDGVNADYIKISPVKNNGIVVVNLYVNPATKQLIRMEQVGTDNTITTISITAYKANQPISPSMFTFNKAQYKNYLITEL